jgi:hypothetical protein
VVSLLLPSVVKPGAAPLVAFPPSALPPPGAADAAPAEANIAAGTNATASTIANLFLRTSFSFLLVVNVALSYADDDGRGGVRFTPTGVEHFGGVGPAW